jgi:hypothetical protein
MEQYEGFLGGSEEHHSGGLAVPGRTILNPVDMQDLMLFSEITANKPGPSFALAAFFPELESQKQAADCAHLTLPPASASSHHRNPPLILSGASLSPHHPKRVYQHGTRRYCTSD